MKKRSGPLPAILGKGAAHRDRSKYDRRAGWDHEECPKCGAVPYHDEQERCHVCGATLDDTED